MSQFKLIATDLDDTLLNDALEVSPRNKRALRKAAEAGAVVTIATGRMFRSALPIALSLGVRIPIITYQGALITDIVSGDILWHKPLPLELARKVLAEGYRAGIHMNVYINDNLYVDSITPEGTGYAKRVEVDMIPIGDLLDFVKVDPTKVIYIAEPSLLDELRGKIHAEMGDSLYITKSKPNYLEFLHPLATKKHAVQALAGNYGIRREEIMVFGDSYNDLDMIEFAGKGVAMGNAPEDIKKKADYVTLTNNEDGVAEAVEKFVLKETKER
ncbi:MAG: Cof-type HAD-IIB family hydrolase [Eubacteriales bacterium]